MNPDTHPILNFESLRNHTLGIKIYPSELDTNQSLPNFSLQGSLFLSEATSKT